MSYSFEGNFRPKPEQNLSGSSKKQTRDVLIQRAHEERQKRQVLNPLNIILAILISSSNPFTG